MQTYLALGDSYTIGEQVPLEQNFPHQTIALLQQQGFAIDTPKIIAQTGWTTDELNAAIDAAGISGTYDIVTLLIGVNNQYRGRDVNNFEMEFENLLQRAIRFACNQPQHVFVLSIPDWGVTPFAAEKDGRKIANEIDKYNLACENVSTKYDVHFIDITTAQRTDGNKKDYIAADQLHPSAKEYTKWAITLSEAVANEILK